MTLCFDEDFYSSFFFFFSRVQPDDTVIILATKAPEGLFSTHVKIIFYMEFGISYISIMSFLSSVLKKICFYYSMFESVVSGGIFGSLFLNVHLQRLFLHASARWNFYSLCQDKVTFEDSG